MSHDIGRLVAVKQKHRSTGFLCGHLVLGLKVIGSPVIAALSPRRASTRPISAFSDGQLRRLPLRLKMGKARPESYCFQSVAEQTGDRPCPISISVITLRVSLPLLPSPFRNKAFTARPLNLRTVSMSRPAAIVRSQMCRGPGARHFINCSYAVGSVSGL